MSNDGVDVSLASLSRYVAWKPGRYRYFIGESKEARNLFNTDRDLWMGMDLTGSVPARIKSSKLILSPWFYPWGRPLIYNLQFRQLMVGRNRLDRKRPMPHAYGTVPYSCLFSYPPDPSSFRDPTANLAFRAPLGAENLASYQWRLYKAKGTSHPVSALARWVTQTSNGTPVGHVSNTIFTVHPLAI